MLGVNVRFCREQGVELDRHGAGGYVRVVPADPEGSEPGLESAGQTATVLPV